MCVCSEIFFKCISHWICDVVLNTNLKLNLSCLDTKGVECTTWRLLTSRLYDCWAYVLMTDDLMTWRQVTLWFSDSWPNEFITVDFMTLWTDGYWSNECWSYDSMTFDLLTLWLLTNTPMSLTSDWHVNQVNFSKQKTVSVYRGVTRAFECDKTVLQ